MVLFSCWGTHLVGGTIISGVAAAYLAWYVACYSGKAVCADTTTIACQMRLNRSRWPHLLSFLSPRSHVATIHALP
jgi:hypothetical protein